MRVLIAATMLAGAMAETTGTTATTTTTTTTATVTYKDTCTGGAACLALAADKYGTAGADCKAVVAVAKVDAKDAVVAKDAVAAAPCAFTAAKLKKDKVDGSAATCTGSETGNTCTASVADKATCEAATDRAFKAKGADTPAVQCKWTAADTAAGTAAKCEGTVNTTGCTAAVADKATCEAVVDKPKVDGTPEVTETKCVWKAKVDAVAAQEAADATCTGGTHCTDASAEDKCVAQSIAKADKVDAADKVEAKAAVMCTFTTAAEAEAAAKKVAEAAAAAAKAAASSAAVLSMIGAAVAFFL